MRFETERLIIRSPIPSDAEDIFINYTQDPEVTKFLTWKPHISIEQSKGFIQYCIENMNTEKKLILSICSKLSNQVIGMHEYRISGFQAELGYVLSRKYWNQGIMTEAIKPTIHYMMNREGIFRIWATHDIDNEASGKVMEKIGMQFEGVLRKYAMHPNISNYPRDVRIYSIVK